MAYVIMNILGLLVGTVYLSKCQPFQISKENLNKALVGHSVLKIDGTNLHDCARDCMSFAICKSFDYDKNERTCKLNDVDSPSVDPPEFVTKTGSSFYSISLRKTAIYVKDFLSMKISYNKITISACSNFYMAMVQKCGLRPCQMDQKCLVNGDSFLCRDLSCPIYQKLDHRSIQVFAHDENKFRDKAMIKYDVGYTSNKQEVECLASGQWQPTYCYLLIDCKEILEKFLQAKCGIYKIGLWKSRKRLTVNCDMETAGGGSTIFHRRMDGSVDFYRNFSEYEKGFGSDDTELWLGLKYIQELANQSSTELRLDMMTESDETGEETFQEFSLIDWRNYTLSSGSSTATAGIDTNFRLKWNNLAPFTTFDLDSDIYYGNCAVSAPGAWWFKECSRVHLNGIYVTPGTECSKPISKTALCGNVHRGFNGYESLKRSSMMLRKK